MNIHNYAQKTTWMLGSDQLELTPTYLKDFSLPGLQFSHPEVYSRPSSKVFFVADNISFNNFSCTILIDEYYKVYFELIHKIMRQFDPETGRFATQEYDIFVMLQDQKGHDVFKVTFHNARLSSIGDISLATDDDAASNTLDVEFVYDYYTIDELENLAKSGLKLDHGQTAQ